MRRLLLVRHAKAEPSVGRDDYERKLTGRGRHDAQHMAEALSHRKLVPEALIHSGAARTKETAEIFAEAWGGDVRLEKDAGVYDAAPSTLLSLIRALPKSRKHVALVGHNPGLGELAVSLAGSGADGDIRRMAAKFPTCAVAVIDFRVKTWEEVEGGKGLLSLFLTPAEVET